MRCEPVVTDITDDTSAETCGIFPGLMRAAGDRPGHNAAPEIVRDACPISSVLRISQIADKTDKPGVTCFITNTLLSARGGGARGDKLFIFNLMDH